MPRYLGEYGLKRATFKISLDENLITALNVLDHLGLRSLHPVQVGDVSVVPRVCSGSLCTSAEGHRG